MSEIFKDSVKAVTVKQKWEFVFKHKKRIHLELDNDDTYVVFQGDNHLKFHNSIGDMPGIFDLLDALKIKGKLVWEDPTA